MAIWPVPAAGDVASVRCRSDRRQAADVGRLHLPRAGQSGARLMVALIIGREFAITVCEAWPIPAASRFGSRLGKIKMV